MYKKKNPGGLGLPSAVPQRPAGPSLAESSTLLNPDETLGQRGLAPHAGASLGMPSLAPQRPAAPPLTAHSPLLNPDETLGQPRVRRAAVSRPGERATVDQNAKAMRNPPAGETTYTPQQGRFQEIDAHKGYTDDLSEFEPVYQQWKDYYQRTGKNIIMKDDKWPARMQDYYDDWFQQQSKGRNDVEADTSLPQSGPSFFQVMDDYFKQLKLAQRDDPNYVQAGGGPPNPNVRQKVPGIYPEAMAQYKHAKWTPDEQKFMMQEVEPSIGDHRTSEQEGQALADDLSGGQYDVGDLMSPGVEAQTTGKPDASVYDPVLKHAMDSVIDRYQREIMPSIGDEAQSYGQYGGSRQGVAEGLAAQGLEKTLGDMSARMNLGAYTDAQSRVIPATQARAGLKKSSSDDRLSHRKAGLSQRAANTKASDDFINRMLKYSRHGTDNDAEALKRYLNMLQLGSPGPSSTQSQPQFRNKNAELLGALGTVASLFVKK
ncbi:MAG: hypothetical protein LC541_14865 [Candidatus Thiodiazotropha sp.]|nr:hypothetical protein [Candidatus Thiodiazotropha sp.]